MHPALLVHGHASSQALWPRVHFPEVGQTYCRYALDLPGHGASDKPPLDWFTLENYTQILYEFCYRLGLKDILLVGHSMGGLLCLNLALSLPKVGHQAYFNRAGGRRQFFSLFGSLAALGKVRLSTVDRTITQNLQCLPLAGGPGWHKLVCPAPHGVDR